MIPIINDNLPIIPSGYLPYYIQSKSMPVFFFFCCHIMISALLPFFLYCLLPFIGRALSGYTTLFNLIPTILTNVQASVKVPLIYQIGNCVFRQIPLVMVMYTVMAIALLPFIYKSFRRYGNK